MAPLPNSRSSIARLMAAMAWIAVGLAAARAGAFAFAVVALGASAIGALLSRGPRRAFFLGFSMFGGAAMVFVFAMGPEIGCTSPTTRIIVRIYEAIHGPGPTTFKSPEEAHRYVIWLVAALNWAITTGHSLIALALALVGGTIFWLIARWRNQRAARVIAAQNEPTDPMDLRAE